MLNLKFDDFIATIQLPVLTQKEIPEPAHYGSNNLNSKNRSDGIVPLTLSDSKNCYSIELTQEQINALIYLTEHQQEILELVYDYTKNTLYPVWIDWIGYDDFLFPELLSINDLKQALAISDLIVYEAHKENFSYIDITFEFLPDQEHGVTLTLHKSRIVGWAPGYGCFSALES